MEIAVCDTSTLIRLRKGKALHCLTHLFKKICIPTGVQKECLDHVLSEASQKPPFEVQMVKNSFNLNKVLGLGETEAINLAVELAVEIILIDDEEAAKTALKFNLTPLKSKDILLIAKENGMITSVKATLDTMRANGENFTDNMYRKIIKEAGEI
ncbi:MAG: hypothetical protein HQK59_11575 [Deltaproteobacteria bacterium]|nr:hypothetical protein [Deltaproteobacteria bacterium]